SVLHSKLPFPRPPLLTVRPSCPGIVSNLAFSPTAALIVTSQGEVVPLQVPGLPEPVVQPLNSEPPAGGAVSLTFGAPRYSPSPPEPQLIPKRALETVPAPDPSLVSESLNELAPPESGHPVPPGPKVTTLSP